MRRTKATHLLNVYVSKRNQLFEFLKKNLQSVHDFGWKSTFQLVWRKDIDEVEAKQGLATQRFGYEYQAVKEVPVRYAYQFDSYSVYYRLFFVHFSAGQFRPKACGALSFEGEKLSFRSKNTSFFIKVWTPARTSTTWTRGAGNKFNTDSGRRQFMLSVDIFLIGGKLVNN